MKIGIVPMSGKPYHIGHDGLVRIAARENDKVRLFVSTADRKRPGEIPISGADMQTIWRTQIEPTLPDNVEIVYTGIPIRAAWTEMGKASEEGSPDVFAIYSDPTDLAQNFPEKSLIKYTGNLFRNNQIILRPVQRSETVDVSGTRMRQWLQQGDKDSFIKHLPPRIDGNAVWNILKGQTAEALIRTFVQESLKRF